MEPRDLPPGEKLKRLRESVGLSLRDVETISEKMAVDKDMQDLSLSLQVEHGIERFGEGNGVAVSHGP